MVIFEIVIFIGIFIVFGVVVVIFFGVIFGGFVGMCYYCKVDCVGFGC